MTNATLPGLSRIVFLTFTALVFPYLIARHQVHAANCEPTDAEDRPSIEELLGPIQQQPPEQEPEEDQAQAKHRQDERRARQIREAREAEIDRLTDKLQTSLDDPNLWLSRARIRVKVDQREGAISDLTQFMKLQGNSADRLAERGQLHYDLHQFEEAEADLNEAVQLEPDNPEILFARGKLFLEQWKTKQAYEDFSKVIDMQPKHKMARYNRAYLLMGVRYSYGNCRQAAEDLKVVVDIDPDWVSARYHYVRALSGIGKYEEVVRHATYVIWHDPDSECMYQYRSTAYRFLEKFDLALADASKYMEFNPRMASRIGARASIYTDMCEHEKAIEDWKVYLEIMPRSRDGYRSLIKSYEALKRYEEAIEAWDHVVEIEPDNSDWPRFRGLLKADAGDYYGALADLTTSIEMGSTHYGNRANVYRKLGEHAKAWADDHINQPAAVKAFVGKTLEYEQELIEEEKVLAAHIDEQLKELEAGVELTQRDAFRPHFRHPAWGRLWLAKLTSLVTSEDAEKQKDGIQGFRNFVDNIQVYPIPPEETEAAVDALTKFASGKHSQQLKYQARVLALGLGVLQVANDPETDATQPDSLHFKTFAIEKDQKGRFREFRYFGLEWIQRIEGDNNYRFRELRRTPQFIEMFDLNRGIWMRLEADRAKRSFNNKDWEFIAKGEITKR